MILNVNDAPMESKPRMVNAGTMTEGGVQYERTQKGSYEATITGFSGPEYVRPSRVGATLTRPTTPYATSHHAFSAINGEFDYVPLTSPVLDSYVPYDVDIEDGPRMNQGVQTMGFDDYHIFHTYSASIPEDRRTELSLTPSQVGGAPGSWVEDYPDGFYQGEIHLGSLRPPSNGPPPGYQTMDDNRFVEYTHSYDDQMDANPRY